MVPDPDPVEERSMPLLAPHWDDGNAGRARIRDMRVILTASEGIRLAVDDQP
ncbi:MAG: hypothetical protein M3Q50_04475 [Chloroflexota bacterium]|nr:hypothetical protein [Chloroflexia bacterium]MDQ3225871.1 hypothetical protein [Chloroflexota bacterium]